jgi:regulator of protease activity HflC (stomatin/prohibitin superfamily)
VQAVNYFLGQKYIEAFKELAMAPNQKFVILPMESAGLLGSIAGIGELAKAANDKIAPSPARGASVPVTRPS